MLLLFTFFRQDPILSVNSIHFRIQREAEPMPE